MEYFMKINSYKRLFIRLLLMLINGETGLHTWITFNLIYCKMLKEKHSGLVCKREALARLCISPTQKWAGMNDWWIKPCRAPLMQLHPLLNSINASKKHSISSLVHLIPPFKHEMSFYRLPSSLTANTLEDRPTARAWSSKSSSEQLTFELKYVKAQADY